MTNLEIGLAVVTVAAFVLNIYQMLRDRSHRKAEQQKAAVAKDRITRAKFAMVTAAETVNMVVGRCSDEGTTIEELANLSRVARGQLQLAVRELETEEAKLSRWKFGRFVSE